MTEGDPRRRIAAYEAPADSTSDDGNVDIEQALRCDDCPLYGCHTCQHTRAAELITGQAPSHEQVERLRERIERGGHHAIAVIEFGHAGPVTYLRGAPVDLPDPLYRSHRS